MFKFYPQALAQLPQFRIYVTLTDKLASHFLPHKNVFSRYLASP